MDTVTPHNQPAATGSNNQHQPTLASKTLVFLLIVASVLVITTMALGLFARGSRLVKDDQYQAVFLTNGQVYFGSLSGANGHYLVLEDVYYLQQNTDQEQLQDSQNEDQQNNLALVKLGNELHGPEDAMFIAQDQVLFWENLKNDSQVVQKIGEAKQ